MITSLSELGDYIHIGGGWPPLGIGGFPNYAKKYATCTSCGKHTELKKSMKGKLYFKCPSCGNLDYLTPDFINDYIDSCNIRCPKDGNYIEAHLGKFGVYIKCEEGHYLKPDEI